MNLILLALQMVIMGAIGLVAGDNVSQVEEMAIQSRIEERIDGQLTDSLGAFRPSGYTGKLLTRLQQGGSETTLNTTPCTTPDGQTISTSATGDYIVLTVNPGAANEEKISASAVSCSGTTLTWTIENRGLSFVATSTVTANKKQHAIGETVIISNDDHFLSTQYPSRDADETITGQWTFDVFPITASTSFASEAIVGAVELATGAEAASSTESGGTGKRLALPTTIATSTAPASGHVIPVTGSDGNLDADFLPALSAFDSASSTVQMIAGDTINGATLPVPVYASTTNDQVFAVDADNINTHQFIGFAITNGTASSSITVQTSGIVGGFTGLSVGAEYHAQDTAGAIATSSGTHAVPVGRAVTSTSLLISKGTLARSGIFSVGTTAQTLTIDLGWRPTKVTLSGMVQGGSDVIGFMECAWTKGSGLVGISAYHSGANTAGGSVCRLDYNGNLMTYAITLTDAGFTLTETESSSFPGGGLVLWTAESAL